MGFQKLICIILAVQCVHGFFPMEHLELSRLSGRVGLDSEEFFSKDETSRHDESISDDYTPSEARHRDDYLQSPSEYSGEFNSGEDEVDTKTYSSLFTDPDENEATYSSAKEDRHHKRDEYFEGLSKKSISSFRRPRKIGYFSTEDLMAGASGPGFNRPLSSGAGRSRRARLSDYDLYYPKRQASEDSRTESRSKSSAPSRSYEDYREFSQTQVRQEQEAERSLDGPSYSSETYPRSPYFESYHTSPPLKAPKASRKTYPGSKSPISEGPPSSSSFRGSKSKDLSSRSASYRPSKPERDLPKKFPPKKFSDTQSRGSFEDDEDDFVGKPLVSTSWSKEKRHPKVFTEENKHYLSATGYGKPVREQFHEQGTTGPHAYKFGYNTGDPENPMARYEERTPDGMVKGSYSYVDPMGKLQVVHYESHPEHGFKTTYA